MNAVRVALLVASMSLAGCIVVTTRHTAFQPHPAVETRKSDVNTAFAMGVDTELHAYTLTGAPRREAFTRALALYDGILQTEPNDHATLNNRANVKRELGDRLGALQDIQRAVHFAASPDRAFYLRQGGDLLRANDEHYAGTQRYWAALETDPYELDAHARIRERLATSERVQLANYLRFLLETRQTERMLEAAAALRNSSHGAEIAGATAAALTQTAVAIPPPELEALAAPLLEQESAATAELRSVLRTERQPFSWLAAHGEPAAAIGAPPHAAFRGLSHAIGNGAARRGELDLAERAHRLATQMPGADEGDLAALMEFYSEYRTLPELRDTIAQVEKDSAAPVFHHHAIMAYEPFGTDACGDDAWGIRHHTLRLIRAHVVPPRTSVHCPIRFAESACGGLDGDCAIQFGTGSGDPGRSVLTIPPDANACALDRAVALIIADYHPGLPPLVIEASPRHNAAATELRNSLLCGGIDPAAVRIAEAPRGSRRIRLRFER